MARSAFRLSVVGTTVLSAVFLCAQDQQPPKQDRWQNRQLSPELSEFASIYETLLSGGFQDALNRFAEFEKKFPASGYADRVLFWKAFCHAKLENFGKAIELNQELVTKFPASRYADDALMRIGEINEKYLHRYPEAITAYRQVMEKFPDSANREQAMNNEAQVLERRVRDFPAAQNTYSQNVQDMVGRNAAAAGFQSGEQNWFAWNGQARIDFIQTNNDHNFVPLTRYYVAVEEMEKGEFTRAETVLLQLVKQYPDARIVDLATLRLALCRQQLGKIAEARQNLEALVSSSYASIKAQAVRRLEEMDAAGVTVELDMYSGRPNPVWHLTAGEVREVARRLESLPPADGAAMTPQLGYRGFVVRNWPTKGKSGRAGEKLSLHIFGGVITFKDEAGSQLATCKDALGLESWLHAKARENGHEVTQERK